jgi:heptosyltransferase-3
MTAFSALKPKKVLFIATRQIGDVLVTTPLISQARELWPDAEFHFLGYRGKLEMLKGNPDISRLLKLQIVPDLGSISLYFLNSFSDTI